MTRHLRRTLVVPLAFFVGAAPAFAQESRTYSPVEAPARYDEDRPSPDFHRDRREAVLAALPQDAVAIVVSSPTRLRSHAARRGTSNCPSRSAAQATPRPWLPSVAVARVICPTFWRTSSLTSWA